MTSGSQHKHNVSTDPVQFAGLRLRALALVADGVLFILIFFPVTRLVKGVWLMKTSDHLWGYGWLITDPICITFLIVIALYFILLEGSVGTTLGKYLTGLRVVQPNGTKPGMKKAVIRNILRLIDGLPFMSLLGAVLILASPERTRLGDRVAGTRVIRIGSPLALFRSDS